MKYTKSLVAALAIASFAMTTSCDFDDFGDINTTPNYPTEGYTYMLFQYASVGSRNFIMTSSSYDPWGQEWSGYLSEAKNNQYGAFATTNDFGSGSYYTGAIKNLTAIIEANTNEETKNLLSTTAFGSNENQIAVATTLRAFYYMTISDITGPIVYSEALQAEDENFQPKYDKQSDVYAGLDKELNDVYGMFDTDNNLNNGNADIFFGGDIAKWKKFNATLRMMMAIKLADVDPATGKARFAKAFADGGMESVDDSFCYTFDVSYARSWFYAVGYQGYASRSNYFAPNKTLVDALKEYKDPRLFTYATIGIDKFAYLGSRPGASEKDFDAYFGIPCGLESNSAVADAKNIACSTAPKYCVEDATYGLITTARCKLVEAEAAVRGWISADAATLYAEGIQASFDFEAQSDKEFDPAQATDYIAAHPLPSSSDEALKEIVMQRFLAGFLTDGIEAWSDWRRFNIPTFPMYAGQINEGRYSYPQRLMFNSTDYATNEANIKAILSDLSNGIDDRWSRVWWDVADNESPIAE